MLGYYLHQRDDMNKYLKWSLIMIWDMIGLALVLWIFFVVGMTGAVYDSIATIGGISFIGLLFGLTVYSRYEVN